MLITFGIVLYLVVCFFINIEIILYYGFWIFSTYLKNINLLNRKIKEFRFKSFLDDVFASAPNIFLINSYEKLIGLIIVVLIFIIRIPSLSIVYRFLIIALMIYLIINIFIRFLKEMDSVLRFLFGQIMIPCFLIIIYIEILQRQLQSENFNIKLYILMLLTLILWQYISIKIYYLEEVKYLQQLNLILCYVQIIITTLLLFIVIGVGFTLYNASIQDIKPNEAILNITENKNAYSIFIALIAYAVDNLTNEIGISVVKSTNNHLIDKNKVIFSILSKAFVSVYGVLILAFVSNTLINKNKINDNTKN
ncbi:hypothetical protein [Staphylococcus equorum]|uniref:hypothetical protein n=1 Tax=Staphylococcus equorum TaxID=246432 RepID=UPI000853A553|nr:hypothetical protein [Staphylococcus equorum]OEK75244.1 hypothetical protein AST05_10920 [Staphylococcus equorum]